MVRTFYWLRDTIVHRLDKGESVCAAFIDLRKTFDSLDHCILLHNLSNLGVSTSVLRWFQNCLFDRAHHSSLAISFHLGPVALRGGISQGSALGPLVFLIYMNALPSNVPSLLLQYADDTTLVYSGPPSAAAAHIMNQQLALIHDWLIKHRMKLNVQKSRVMWFYNKRQKKQQFYPCIHYQ